MSRKFLFPAGNAGDCGGFTLLECVAAIVLMAVTAALVTISTATIMKIGKNNLAATTNFWDVQNCLTKLRAVHEANRTLGRYECSEDAAGGRTCTEVSNPHTAASAFASPVVSALASGVCSSDGISYTLKVDKADASGNGRKRALLFVTVKKGKVAGHDVFTN